MRKLILAFVILIISSFFSGCARKNMPDTYVSGMDYQFFTRRSSQGSLASDIQYVDDGAYFRLGEYIYYYDKVLNAIHPLCDKPDCLHDKETDPDKKDKCNAHINAPEEVPGPGLQYYDGDLYVMYATEFANGGYRARDTCRGTVLYKFSGDGSSKEEVWRADEGWNGDEFIIHRGKAYIVAGAIFYTDSGVDQKNVLYEIDLRGGKKKKEIFRYEEDCWTSSLGFLTAYGNHLYFQASKIVIILDEDGNEAVSEHYNCMYEYNILDSTLNQINLPAELDEKYNIMAITFFDDHLIYEPYYLETNEIEEFYILNDIYMAELDGSNPKIILEDIPQGYEIQSDGEYLYINNSICAYLGDSEKDPVLRYWVYDDEFEKIKEFNVSNDITGYGNWQIAIGNPKWGCITINNSYEDMQKAFFFEKDWSVVNDSQNLDVKEIPYDYPAPYKRTEYIED